MGRPLNWLWCGDRRVLGLVPSPDSHQPTPELSPAGMYIRVINTPPQKYIAPFQLFITTFPYNSQKGQNHKSEDLLYLAYRGYHIISVWS